MKTIIFFYLIVTKFSKCVPNEGFEGEDSSFIFFSNNDDLIEDESKLVGMDIGKSKKILCESENLTSFLIQLQVINPESVIDLATTKNIDNLCINVSKGQDKLQHYLKTCTLTPDQENYNRIFQGVRMLHAKLCKDSKYHALFLQYAPCYGKLKNEFDSCTGPADWSENSEGNKVCKAYKDIADCYFLKTSVLCGTKAADVFKELVMAVIDSVITVNCSDGSLNQQNITFAKPDNTVSRACICSSPWYKTLVEPFINIYEIIRLIPWESKSLIQINGYLVPANNSDLIIAECQHQVYTV